MNSNFIPIRLRPHLVNFLLKEMKGEEKTVAGKRHKVFEVPKKTFLAKFIVDYLEKTEYPVKDIQRFNFILEIKQTTRRKFIASAKIFKIEKLSTSYVQLPAEYAKMVNDLFEQQFRNAFINFVDSRSHGNELLISQSILEFIDKYDLFEADITQVSLRRLYYRLKKNGLCADLQGRLYK